MGEFGGDAKKSVGGSGKSGDVYDGVNSSGIHSGGKSVGVYDGAKYRKWWYIGAGVIAALVVILVAVIIVRLQSRATLDIVVAPESAKVLVDGVEYENGVYRVEPGVAKVVISKEGFKTKELEVNLKAGETTKLYTYLMTMDGSYQWYLEHPEDQMILNTIGDGLAGAAAKDYLAKYPIVKVLPIIYANYDAEWNYTEYRVDGGEFDECKAEFCLKITDTTGGNYEAALMEIAERGYRPEDYEIVYQYKPIEDL